VNILVVFCLIISPTECAGRLCFHQRLSYMFVNNFLAPIQVRLSPNIVSRTLGHKGQTKLLNFGRSKVKVGGGGMHSTECPSSFPSFDSCLKRQEGLHDS